MLKLKEWFMTLRSTWLTTCRFCLRMRVYLFWIGILGLISFLIQPVFFSKPPFRVVSGLSMTPLVYEPDRHYSATWFIHFEPWCDICDYQLTRYITGCGLHLIGSDIPAKPEPKVRVNIPQSILVESTCAYQTRVNYSCNLFQRLFPGVIDFPPLLFSVRGARPFTSDFLVNPK